ncbi:MAG: prefoldin subunit [Candidatus Micrarchaeota archaeon]|nr:prefoldin subunit [Candidatus Micrarchaeota archaeon]
MAEEMEKKIIDYQNYAKQLELIVAQKAQYMTRKEELNIAMEEVKKLPEDAVVFRMLGGFLVQVERQEAEKQILDELNEASLRIDQLEKQEKRLSEKLQSLRTELESILKPGSGSGGLGQ